MENKNKYVSLEKREHIRWSQIVPAAYKLIDGEREISLGKWHLGTIHNISVGGLCLEAGEFEDGNKEELFSGRTKILLKIKLPGLKEPILAIAKAVWLSKLWKEKAEGSGKCLIGVTFEDISSVSKDTIVDYVLKTYAAL